MALLITIAIRFLEIIFAMTMIEDFQELFGKEKTNHETGDYFPAGSKR